MAGNRGLSLGRRADRRVGRGHRVGPVVLGAEPVVEGLAESPQLAEALEQLKYIERQAHRLRRREKGAPVGKERVFAVRRARILKARFVNRHRRRVSRKYSILQLDLQVSIITF
jgi:hypothetical protein